MAVKLKSSRLKDVQATCLAYDSQNGNVILPGRRAFMFVSLSESELPAARYTLRQAAVVDATRIYCNPTQPTLFVIARGQALEFYEYNKSPSQTSTEICSKKMEIQAHSKAVDDIAWCPSVSNWVVSCSRDQYAVLWDTARNDAVSNFRATSPFSCCCWLYSGKTSMPNNSSPTSTPQLKQGQPAVSSTPLSGYVVVTTADSRLLFWDIRVGGRPAIVVQAHALRIHGLDAGSASSEQYNLITAADGDSHMALWDIRNLDRKISSIDSPFGNQPPRRMRFSPAGGFLAVTASTMPRSLSADEPRAAVISLADFTSVMLPDHVDHVYDAIWPSGEAVLTWSQDFYLRQFQVASRSIPDQSGTPGIASSLSDVTIGLSRHSTPSTPPMLRPGYLVDSQSNAADLSVSSTSANLLAPLASPTPTVTPIIPQPPPLPTQLPSAANLQMAGTPVIQFALQPTDYMIPSPRTAGARFCPAGFLVSLHRLYELKQKPSDRVLADFNRATAHPVMGGRPRGHRARHTSLSRPSEGPGSSSSFAIVNSGLSNTLTAGVLVSAVSPGGSTTPSLQQFGSSLMSSGGISLPVATNSNAVSATNVDHTRQHTVLVYSVNALLKCNRELAIECRLDWVNPATCCRSNVDIAMAFDRPDLAQAFSVAALVLDDTSFLTKPDLVGCIGRDALIRMFAHFVKQGCLQDAAMLAFFLSFTGIDLNSAPEDFDGNATNANTYLNHNDSAIHGNRTPPDSMAGHHSFTASAALNSTAHGSADSNSLGMKTDGMVISVPSPLAIQGGQPMKLTMMSVSPDYVEVSAVKRSSSWHDVQNVSPVDSGLAPPGDGSASASGETRSRHPSIRQQISPIRGPNNGRLSFAACRNMGQSFGGYTESERIQMAVVLRCYATQLHAWRLHDRRAALLRPLNAVSAGQLSSIETITATETNTRPAAQSAAIPMIRSNTGLHHQSSVDSTNLAHASSVSLSVTSAGAATNTNVPICAVCDRPIRGLSSICVLCGHGGHALHIQEFFSSKYSGLLSCPAGCGCHCPSLRLPYIEV